MLFGDGTMSFAIKKLDKSAAILSGGVKELRTKIAFFTSYPPPCFSAKPRKAACLAP